MLVGFVAAIANGDSLSVFAAPGPLSLAQAGSEEKPADRPAGEAALPLTRGDLEVAQSVEDGGARREGSVNDQFYGGMSVSWAWDAKCEGRSET